MADWLRQNYHPKMGSGRYSRSGVCCPSRFTSTLYCISLVEEIQRRLHSLLNVHLNNYRGRKHFGQKIVIYDNKIATKKFDQFTFNNIKGRAGRMLKHFVGHVYVLHAKPDPELPIVDFPSFTQSDGSPESLLIQLEQRDLSERSKEQLRYLHAQDILPIEVMRQNNGVDPRKQLDLATEISSNLAKISSSAFMDRISNRRAVRRSLPLIFDYLMEGHGRDGVVSAKQLAFFVSRFAHLKSIPKLFQAELENPNNTDPTEAIERVLKFLDNGANSISQNIYQRSTRFRSPYLKNRE